MSTTNERDLARGCAESMHYMSEGRIPRKRSAMVVLIACVYALLVAGLAGAIYMGARVSV